MVALNIKNTRTFANTAARVTAVPAFIGQFGRQLDNGSIWWATALTAGAWESTFDIASIQILPTDGTGFIGLAAQASTPATPASGAVIFGATNSFAILNTDGNVTLLDTTLLTSDRAFSFPDASGTFALTSTSGQLTGNMLWVDAVNGDDATGTRGNDGLPYLTITAAKAAASAGDTIVVRPGTYDEKNLLKDEVNYFFELGAIVEYTGSSNGAVFDDSSTGANAAIHCKISGDGRFIYAGTGAAATNPHVFHITNSASHIDASGQEIFQNSTTATADPSGIHQANGYIRWWGHAIEANVSNSGVGNAAAVWWSDGDNDILIDRLKTTGEAYLVYGETVAAGSTLWVRTAHAHGSTLQTMFSMTGADVTARLLITAQTIDGSTLDGSSQIVNIASGYLGLDALSVIHGSGGSVSNGFGLQGGESNIEIQRLIANGTSGDEISITSGTHRLKFQSVSKTGATNILDVSGGTAYVSLGEAVSNTSGLQSTSVVISAGTLSIFDSRIDASALTTRYPVQITGGTLSLRNCVLICNGSQDSINASTPQNVAILGACWGTNAVNANVTLTPLGLFTAGSTSRVSGLTISGTLTNNGTWADGVRQTFNPNATNAGINVGSLAGDPASPSNGDLWYDSTANELTARINGSNVALGGGGTSLTGTANGRLTLTSGTPVLTSTVSGAGTVYFTPYLGNQIALYDGASAWTVLSFSELSLTLSALTASTVYDVWVYNNGGTAALDTTAWTNATTRATALALQDGVYVKTGATTRRYVGTIVLDGSKQCSVVFGGSSDGGTAGKCDIWNMNNRTTFIATVRDTTNSWNWATLGWQQANASAGNQVTVLLGVALAVRANYTTASGGTTNIRFAGIGLDATNALAAGSTSFPTPPGGTGITGHSEQFGALVAEGQHIVSAIEYGNGSVVFYGDNNTTQLRSGLTVSYEY